MSGPYSFGDSMAPADTSDLNYPVYDPRYATAFGAPPGTSSHFDGGGFWYRSENVNPVYENGPSGYGRGMPMTTSEHIKHRRTRSGCFTCRSRRVKCDESRPVCDRCRKGNRQCDYPPPTLSGPSKKAKHAEARSGETLTLGREGREIKEEDDSAALSTIKDESEEEAPGATSQSRPRLDRIRTQSTQSLNRKQRHRQQSEASSASREKVTTPSTDTSSSLSRSQTPSSSLQTNPPASNLIARQARWAHLRSDIQKYLQFHNDHLTYYHYFFKDDVDDFMHTELIDLALLYDPLLYAVAAFAAYHHTVRQPDGQMSNFLGYYTKSLSLLRRFLGKGSKPTEATLLTVLQLATLEEYLGDWVNLSTHHRAAHYMLLGLYKPENVMETEVTRRIIAWYARFDVIAGLMAGNETILDRQWYSTCASWFQDRIDPEDVDVEYSFQYIIATNRLIGIDVAALFSKLPKGAISMETFIQENAKISDRLQQLKVYIESLNDVYYTVAEFPHRSPLTSEDIVNPYVPGGLFRDAFWPLNYIWVDWYGIYQMHTYQTSIVLQQPAPLELEQVSLEQCRIYEAIERWPDAPQGSTLGVHASLALASVFLPKDERHIMWARRKLAQVERMGYVFPPTFRQKMAEMWRAPEVEGWWLPNDQGYLPILKEIRALIGERAANNHGSTQGEDLRDIKAIFSKLNISGLGGSMSGGEESSPGSNEAGLTPPNAVSAPGSLAEGTRLKLAAHHLAQGQGDGTGGPHQVQQQSQVTAGQAALRRRGESQSLTAGQGVVYGDRMSGVWDGQ